MSDPFGLEDYNEQQTQAWLQQAYNSATGGRIQGLLNIEHNSSSGSIYDFGFNQHRNDTWTRCGRKMNADQFGNYMAGFQAAAYDEKFFWTTGAIWAETGVKLAGLYYHLRGLTKAKHDPFDRTGFPDINNGEADGWDFHTGECPCDKKNPNTQLSPYQIYVITHH